MRIALVACFLLSILPINVSAGDRYVTVSGSDTSNDCSNPLSPCATIDHAIGQATAGDTVKVACGTYNENIRISTSINPLFLQGGWSSDFSTRSDDPSLTVIDGGGSDRVLKLDVNLWVVLTMEGFKITNGYNASGCGGLYASAQPETSTMDLTLINNIFTNNNGGTASGGAICAGSSQGGSMTLTAENNIIRNNEAGTGSGIALDAYNNGETHAQLTNNIIADNGSASIGGGIYVKIYSGNIDVDLTNNTITNNSSSPIGGGVVVISQGSGYSSTVDSTNDIIWGNSPYDVYIAPWDDVSTAEVTTFYSDVGSVEVSDTYGSGGTYNEGEGVIDAEPLFINAAHGNYHLRGNSPCINAGILEKRVWVGSWIYYDFSVPEYDFEGDPRASDWVETTPNHYYKYCDIGADEYTPSFVPGIPLLLLGN